MTYARLASARIDQGRWIMWDPDGHRIGDIGDAQDDVSLVEGRIREILSAAGKAVGDVGRGVVAGSLVAYGTPAPEATPRLDDSRQAPTAEPLGRAEVLQLVAGLADGGVEFPSNTHLTFHRTSPDLVRTWAGLLGLPEPTYSDVKVLPGHDLYRALKSSGRCGAASVEITGFVDIADDPTGLEGTGWLDEVWIATRRRGVAAHRPDGDERTVCGRSTRTGERTTARQATDRHGASFGCPKCWPTGSPIVSEPGGAA